MPNTLDHSPPAATAKGGNESPRSATVGTRPRFEFKSGPTKVPNAAFRFDAGQPFQFADADADGRIPVRLAARSAKPIQHWYWGNIVHDMAGFKADGARVPIDYDHWEAVGFADQFDADPQKGLQLAGEIHKLSDGDTVDTLYKRSKLGTPYQASIFFAGEKYEYVERGETAEVNGSKFRGPGIIVREWRLRGVAITLYGADHRTKTKFSGSPFDAGETEVEIFSHSTPGAPPGANSNPTTLTMSATATEKPQDSASQTTDTQSLSAGTATTPATSTSPAGSAGESPASLGRSQFTAELKRFTDKFGGENGAKWFAEGKTYEQALELHAAELATKLAAETKRREESEQKLSQAGRGGEEKPLSFSDGEKPTDGGRGSTNEFATKIGDNLGAFAASIKMPGQK